MLLAHLLGTEEEQYLVVIASIIEAIRHLIELL